MGSSNNVVSRTIPEHLRGGGVIMRKVNERERTRERKPLLHREKQSSNFLGSSVNWVLTNQSFPHQESLLRINEQPAATHCISLQHAARHCNTLHDFTTRWNTLQHAVTHCYGVATISRLLKIIGLFCRISSILRGLLAEATPYTLRHTAIHCNILQHTETHCFALQRTATHCNAQQHTATHCNTL